MLFPESEIKEQLTGTTTIPKIQPLNIFELINQLKNEQENTHALIRQMRSPRSSETQSDNL